MRGWRKPAALTLPAVRLEGAERDRAVSAYAAACKLFALVAGDDRATQADWEEAWLEGERCRSLLFGEPMRRPGRDAYRKRRSLDTVRVYGRDRDD